jgi:hypothetical protein
MCPLLCARVLGEEGGQAAGVGGGDGVGASAAECGGDGVSGSALEAGIAPADVDSTGCL